VRRALLIALLLAACRGGEFAIKPDTYARAMNLPDAERSRAVVRARDEANDETWVRLSNLDHLRIASNLVRAHAPRRRQLAGASLVLGVVSLAVIAVGATVIAAGANYSPSCYSMGCWDFGPTPDYAVGGVFLAIGAAGLIIATTFGAIQLKKPDSEVKPGRADLVYVP
jgi:hypothetical protein